MCASVRVRVHEGSNDVCGLCVCVYAHNIETKWLLCVCRPVANAAL